jgi:hypothetical protein
LFSTNIEELAASISGQFSTMRDWCIINLDINTWQLDLLCTPVTQTTLKLSHTFTFSNQEDVVAFKLVFGL